MEPVSLLGLLLLLTPQVLHTVYLFEQNSQFSNPWFAWCYALGVDIAILIFTYKGWVKLAMVFFLSTLTHNIAYMFWGDSVFAAILVCIVQSGTLFSYTHLFASNRKPELNTDLSILKGKKLVERGPYADRLDELLALRQRGIAIEPLPHVCPECGRAFHSSKELNGHISTHKRSNEWHEERYGDWEQMNRANEKYLSKYPWTPLNETPMTAA